MNRNSLGREIPDGFCPYDGSEPAQARRLIAMKATPKAPIFLRTISDVFDALDVKDGMTFSFHHHLREGDKVLNLVMAQAAVYGLKDLTIAPSSIFPCHQPLVPLLDSGVITGIVTNYMNGPVADAVTAGKLQKPAIMDTHGGRARAIESGDLPIDVAFLAVPQADKLGNGTGKSGKNACGTLGYAIPDATYAKRVVL
ncbi:MAG: citrate lyase subunit alpha, partial [Bacillota bacterium]|nr:citrate lyase subunit alpha [Bacillota bacterium]